MWQDGQCVQEEPVPSGCSDEHTEGELALKLIGSGDKLVLNKCSLTECATTSYHWHCGADTEYEWEKKEETNCEPKPSDTKPCENAGNKIASGNMTATYTCTSSGWSQSGWDSSACRYTWMLQPSRKKTRIKRCNAITAVRRSLGMNVMILREQAPPFQTGNVHVLLLFGPAVIVMDVAAG
ncbi:MAG: hypothetical protein PUC11_00090 [Elusimicrobia bacterium]|nr:hypothetical protein [Elusimicrobiota bacterium]